MQRQLSAARPEVLTPGGMAGVSLVGSSVVAFVFDLSGGGHGRTVVSMEMPQDIPALSFHP